MITMKQLIFTQKIGYNLYSCCLVIRWDKKVYEISSNRVLKTIDAGIKNTENEELDEWIVLKTIEKWEQTMEELENLFFDISFNDFKKEVLKKANKF